ncbi:MAG TPA: S8/S53 family peptidase [Polyangia bacterium]
MVTAVLIASGCRRYGLESEALAATAPPAARPEAVKPTIHDRFATPYAVVPARSEQDPCLLQTAQVAGTKQAWEPVSTLRSRLERSLDKNKKAVSLRAARPGTSGFCVYKWADKHHLPTPADFKAIGAIPDSALLGGSSPSASGPDMPESVYRPLLKMFDKMAGGVDRSRVEAARAKLAKVTKTAQSVKVAVIDATPRSKGLMAPDRSYHGFAVSRIIGKLACADENSPACAEKVVPQLALPIIGEAEGDFTEDWETGGRTGTFSQLYDALDLALEEWRPSDEHLIINLSVGWDPVKTEPDDENVARIKTVLERASCMGALIVAAAGNFSGSPGPVYPAAFEAVEAPTGAACARFNVTAATAAKKLVAARAGKKVNGRYAPLVYSVGAVDALDRRTLVNRRWGQPRLAALGAAVTVPGPPNMPYVSPMDGTSMSAAIVSGIAAAVWEARPELDAAGVMQMIYEGGVKLEPGVALERAQTEYCVGEPFGPCHQWPVRRAFLCGALAKALPQAKMTCDPTPATAAELPQWPTSSARPAVAPETLPQPCHMTECGIPFGPMENQLPAGIVEEGIGNCNGCTFQVLNTGGTITLQGTPTLTLPPGSTMDWYTATLNTDMSQSWPISPTFGTPMNGIQVTGASSGTGQASISWTVKIHLVSHTYTNTSPLTRVPPQ